MRTETESCRRSCGPRCSAMDQLQPAVAHKLGNRAVPAVQDTPNDRVNSQYRDSMLRNAAASSSTAAHASSSHPGDGATPTVGSGPYGRPQIRSAGCPSSCQRQIYPEEAGPIVSEFHGQVTAHGAHDGPADGQPKARTLIEIAASPATELLEYKIRLFPTDSSAVVRDIDVE